MGRQPSLQFHQQISFSNSITSFAVHSFHLQQKSRNNFRSSSVFWSALHICSMTSACTVHAEDKWPLYNITTTTGITDMVMLGGPRDVAKVQSPAELCASLRMETPPPLGRLPQCLAKSSSSKVSRHLPLAGFRVSWVLEALKVRSLKRYIKK